MSKKVEWMLQRRRQAQAAGLCGTCCKRSPEAGRRICALCTESARGRSRHRNATLRSRLELQRIVEASERAGDKAREYHLYEDAAQHYREALNVTAVASDDQLRLVEKLGSTSLLSLSPITMQPWQDVASATSVDDSQKAEKTVEALLQIARNLWTYSNTKDSLPLYERAVRVAEIHGTERLRKLAKVHLAQHLNALGQFDAASKQLENLGTIDRTDDLSIRILYHHAQGYVAAMRGLADRTYEHHETAVRLAKRDSDLFRVVSVLGDYGLDAISLGDIERGKALYEQALLIVRRNHLGWLVPHLCMGYAGILARMGQQAAARGYLLEALSSGTHTPLVEERFAAVGIPIALYLRDESILTQCIRPTAISLAFQSGVPARIGPVAAAFAHLYAVQGKRSQTRTLLRKALRSINYVDENIEVLVVAAQYGALADAPSARALLEKRLRLPSAHLAEACMLLFDALLGHRMHQPELAQRTAAEAAERFGQLHWYAYSDLARSLIPSSQAKSVAPVLHDRPLAGSLLTLTEREQQVVELVLQGYTNREIAERLSIREHTVEKHMGSIMGRLGIRSRYQLEDALAE